MANPISKTELINASTDANSLSVVTNGDDVTNVTSRLGRVYPTIAKLFKGFRDSAAVVLTQIGYAVPVTYASAIVLTSPNQTVSYNGVVYAPISNQLPFTTSGTFETAKFRVIQGVTAGDLIPLQTGITLATTQATAAGLAAATANAGLAGLVDASRQSLFTVQPNKSIVAPDGSRFVIRGVTMFDYLFIGHEPRVNYLYRSIYNPPGKGTGTGISEPTYYARWSYINTANVIAQLTKAKGVGINLVRVAVEPAIMLATTSYVDPSDGLTYPADLTMLDDIIKQAGILGLVVQLQNANDMVPVADNVIFLRQIADRYKAFPWVWINPANELNGGNGSGDVNNIPVWTSTMVQYMDALRQPLPSGGRFLNPVIVNPPYYGNNLNGVVSILNTNPSFRDDPNMLVGIHIYAFAGENDFRTTRLPTEVTQWFQYLDQFCIFIDEVGIDNFAGRYDPNIDPSIPSVNPTAWGQMQNWAGDFLRWSWEQSTLNNMNGLTGFMWYAWIPGLVMHDDNTMLRMDGTWTTWGNIFVGNYSSHPVRRLDMRRSLGADFDTGAWSTGDIVDGSITNAKLAADWLTYAPTVTATSGAISAVTATGRWIQVGKVLFFQVTISLTTNGTGAGALLVTLPSSPVGASHACSGIQVVNNFACAVRTTQGVEHCTVYKYDGSYPGASAAQFILTGAYEVA